MGSFSLTSGVNLMDEDKKDYLRHRIDISFIRKKEGVSKEGYIPKDKNGKILGKSGVTIGSGIDLGQRSVQELKNLGVNPVIIEKVKNYTDKKGNLAEITLKKFPLRLENDELNDLEEKIYESNFTKYIDYYEKETGKKFDNLNRKFQTAIGSVISQYGPNLKEVTPKFNKAIIENDIKRAKEELENFGDAYPTRRKLEASLLEGLSLLNPFAKEAHADKVAGVTDEQVAEMMRPHIKEEEIAM